MFYLPLQNISINVHNGKQTNNLGNNNHSIKT